MKNAPNSRANLDKAIQRFAGNPLMSISDLIGEATTYDKKLSLERKEPLSWLKSMSAFANTIGGQLIFGVADNGKVDYARVRNICRRFFA